MRRSGVSTSSSHVTDSYTPSHVTDSYSGRFFFLLNFKLASLRLCINEQQIDAYQNEPCLWDTKSQANSN